MYQDKSSRKRRVGRETARSEALASSPFTDLTDIDIQRAAAGII
jgi:hypothetical protein